MISGFNEIHCNFQLSASTHFCDFTLIRRNYENLRYYTVFKYHAINCLSIKYFYFQAISAVKPAKHALTTMHLSIETT